MKSLDKWCEAYLADTLDAEERKTFEARLASGDKELIQTLKRLQGVASFDSDQNTEEKQTQEADDISGFEAKILSTPSPEETNQNYPVHENNNSVSRSSQWIVRLAGGLALVAILLLTYSQWRVYLLDQDLKKSATQIQEMEDANKALKQSNRGLEFQLSRLKSIFSSDQQAILTLRNSKADSIFSTAKIALDYGTQRVAMMLQAHSLPDSRMLVFWVRNREGTLNLLGKIDTFAPDSLYLDFNGVALTHGRYIEVKLHRSSPLVSPETGILLGKVRLP